MELIGLSSWIGKSAAVLTRCWRGFVAGIKHRRDLSRLADLDDHMLADIGLTRSDLHVAHCEPFWRDPTSVLEGRVSDRRAAFELAVQFAQKLSCAGAPRVRAGAAAGTLLLSRSDVERLLTPDECISAVEDAFRQHALGKAPAPGILGLHAEDGSFHIKAALLTLGEPYFAAKTNANFPHNGARHGLPTIQGVVVLCEAVTGQPLAVMDSMAITALRTAAATAVAAKYLARKNCKTALICGCGGQGPAQLRALLRVRRPERIYACDQDAEKARAFAAALGAETGLPITTLSDLPRAVAESDIVVTCTTAHRYFITREMVRPGTFVAGVGADNENKQELDPALLAASKLVTDLTEQCAVIGDLHHALAAGAMTRSDVHAELGEIVAGLKPARASEEETIVFDSSGTALEDVAAAVAVYRQALAHGEGAPFSFNA
jgi:alanine dehydrogenase